MANHTLEVYLNDHLAGATAGLNVARLAADEHQQDEHGAFFAEIASEIAKDYDVLKRLMAAVGADRNAAKTALAELGSKVLGPKLAGGGDDVLNAFVALETLSIGVEGKLCMWTALARVADANPALAAFDLPALAERARSQRARIEEQRLRLAADALVHRVAA